MVAYDMKYALRLCSEHKKQEACVHIYSTIRLYEEAVDLALTVSFSIMLLDPKNELYERHHAQLHNTKDKRQKVLLALIWKVQLTFEMLFCHFK